ncbi:MAG: hypothetical protein GFH27_549319n132 [Chloroflexi bacterium AL-W]|nr:hypothetical protein [Chloroflexi bacterium AL-N1]NOK71295.1 hypothetical protein [Chloroflexi bacterium AL-N10]NOK77670.1 hypothetical protein [Chloroflexi bacterium AL-N5]NOK84521.1 hypothetical protein [Chloroflexi bacterium AL-W]NOK92972.1 hypothetical protein [Chloroflexi bacterium AL-N15]
MNRLRHTIVSLLLVGLIAIANIPAAHAATDLGGLDLYTYCHVHHKWWAPQMAVLILPMDAASWRCRDRTGHLNSINTNHVCAWQYGYGAWASTSNWDDPYSWRCYR